MDCIAKVFVFYLHVDSIHFGESTSILFCSQFSLIQGTLHAIYYLEILEIASVH